MKKIFIILLCCMLLTSCGNAVAANEYLILIDNTTATDTYSQLSPAIVGVKAETVSSSALGAGVCVAPGGYILTNSHVINNADLITLYLSDGSTTTAQLVFEDSVLDFAIIRSATAIPYLALNMDTPVVGQSVIAVGTPISLMLKHTFTKGIVSAVNRTIAINSANGEAYMQNLIQHDASLNPGNSGGPLLNEDGEVIGINTLKITSGEGIGFAIPTRSFISLLNKVTSTTTLSTPYLGVYGYDAEIAAFNQLSQTKVGFYIEDIHASSPAAAYISAGDIITAINGESISNASDLRHELYKYNYGDNVAIEYIKGGKKHRCHITLSQSNTNIRQN